MLLCIWLLYVTSIGDGDNDNRKCDDNVCHFEQLTHGSSPVACSRGVMAAH